MNQFCDLRNKVHFDHEVGVVYNTYRSISLATNKRGNTYVVDMDSAQSVICFFLDLFLKKSGCCTSDFHI